MSQNPSSDLSGEQPFSREIHTQLGFDLPIDRMERNFSQGLSNEQEKILHELKSNDPKPLTKVDLAQLLYPKVFEGNVSEHWIDPYGKKHSRTDKEQRYYVDKVGQQLRAINQSYRTLESLDTVEEEIEHLQRICLAIQIGTDDKGRTLYLYHGPDHFQSDELLEKHQEWSERHKEGQGQHAKWAAKLRIAAKFRQSAETPQMDVDDFPGLIEPEQENQQ
ncbi:MAG: hypothetical protein AAGD25_33030 [Cyanobacteria bacterium P01_F01_bin.150]